MDWNGRNGVATGKAWHEMELSKTNRKKKHFGFPFDTVLAKFPFAKQR